MYRRLKDRVHFYTIYVCEAHPGNGRSPGVRKTWTASQRRQNACDFARQLSLTMPVLVDSMDNHTYNDYYIRQAAFCVIDADGKPAYRSGMTGMELSTDGIEDVLNRLSAKPRAETSPRG